MNISSDILLTSVRSLLRKLELIVSKMDNDSIKSLLIPSIWEEVSSFISHSNFWFLRTQNLVEKDLLFEEGNWKQAYYIFSRMKDSGNYQFDNLEDNSILVSIFVSLGHDPSRNDNFAILQASANGHVNIVRALLKYVYPSSVNSSIRSYDIIGEAAKNNHVDVVILLLSDERVRLNSGHSNALLSACMHGSIDVILHLLSDKDTNQESLNMALVAASGRGQTEVVRLLLRDGRSDPTYDNYLCISISHHTEVVELLKSNSRVDLKHNFESVEEVTNRLMMKFQNNR